MQFYARTFTQILQSSLAENWIARHVFEDFLKLTDNGIVDMTRESIARMLNIPLDVVNGAIAFLEAPDQSSRDPTEGGRRIVRLDEHRNWGWRIVNWKKYDDIKTRADQRESAKNRQKKFRDEAQLALLEVPDLAAQAEQIYAHYPLKSAKPNAIRAIVHAIKREGSFDKLLERTKRFAAVRAGDTSFCPHPSTWFNQERYNDDPSTWKSNEQTNRSGGQQRVDRNKGTYNEGLPSIASELAAKARTANVPGPDAGATGGGDGQLL